MKWNPVVSMPFPETTFEEILNEALKVLQQIGVACHHPEMVKRMTAHKGIRHVNGRFKFEPFYVRDFLESVWNISRRGKEITEPEPPFSLGGCFTCLFYCDPVSQQIRPATTADALEMARFWGARRIDGTVPVIPGDVSPAIATLTSEYVSLLAGPNLGGSLSVSNEREIRFLVDMYLAAGRRYALIEQIAISPLRFNDEGLDRVFKFIGRQDLDVGLSGSIPMAGATCPLPPWDALVQSTAETLAFELACQVLKCQGSGRFFLRVEPFDLQYSTIVFGSAEWCLYHALVRRMGDYLRGAPLRNGQFRSVAKRPDAQAACERTASVLWQALLGARHFGAVGQLSIDEVFSPQQVVFDGEILAHVERIVHGVELKPGDRTSLQVIIEGVAEGAFLGVPSTVNDFRSFYSFPSLFRHWSLGQWRAAGEPSLLAEAWEKVRAQISGYSFRLPEDREKEVDKIYRKATESLTGNKPAGVL